MTIPEYVLKMEFDYTGDRSIDYELFDVSKTKGKGPKKSLGRNEPVYNFKQEAPFRMEIKAKNLDNSVMKGIFTLVIEPIKGADASPLELDDEPADPNSLANFRVKLRRGRFVKVNPKGAGNQWKFRKEMPGTEMGDYAYYKISGILSVDDKDFSFDPIGKVGPKH